MNGANPAHRGTGAPRTFDPWDGVLLVDKPGGMTSHDVVAAIRRRFRIKKVGHGGTLDPMATGLLVILTGKGTKLSNIVMGSDKTYEGAMTMGIATTTQDAEGDTTAERPFAGVTEAAVRERFGAWTGDVMQTPPMVSAIKKDGVPLYKMARKGKEVEREPRLIHVYDFSLLTFTPPDVTFRLTCTKGTYVRTLCADIGEELGCGAHLSALRRTRSGSFDLKDAVTLDELLDGTEGDLYRRILPMHTVTAYQPGG